MINKPKEGERFIFNTKLEFGVENKKANELGLRARIEDVERNDELNDVRFFGVWVKNDSTPSKRS